MDGSRLGDDGAMPGDGLGETDRGPDAWQMPERPECITSYESPTTVGPVTEAGLIEASGIVASPLSSDVLWLHSDSGTLPRVYALDTLGQTLGYLDLGDVPFADPEDIAAGPCPNLIQPCLWIADTGNNNQDRSDLALIAIAEPAVSSTAAFGVIFADLVWRFPLAYPGSTADVEALVMEPNGSAAYLFEKIDGPNARVFAYDAPFDETEATTLRLVGTVSVPGVPVTLGLMITAADLHPSGDKLLLRVYTGIFEYRLDGHSFADLDQAQVVVVAWGPLSEPQGEAVAYGQTGNEIWSISEDDNGTTPQPLHHYACRDPG